MGQKLNAIEELQASLANSHADRQQGQTERWRQQRLQRIADTLGITMAELSEPSAPSQAIEDAINLVIPIQPVLTQQCVDLLTAFLKIQDPQDRLRCLQIVSHAASVK